MEKLNILKRARKLLTKLGWTKYQYARAETGEMASHVSGILVEGRPGEIHCMCLCGAVRRAAWLEFHPEGLVDAPRKQRVAAAEKVREILVPIWDHLGETAGLKYSGEGKLVEWNDTVGSAEGAVKLIDRTIDRLEKGGDDAKR